ncbi:unnamed protein product [Caenorhabditis auriculariae]|uniref:Uncharacterized protein n=1 Tax=Caenorhabditis auriculariae TaxID=2777116 RepID=A0A8S1HX51_9PELO|nr:unnamed protein product [Caenorhabditis auriculariae]
MICNLGGHDGDVVQLSRRKASEDAQEEAKQTRRRRCLTIRQSQHSVLLASSARCRFPSGGADGISLSNISNGSAPPPASARGNGSRFGPGAQSVQRRNSLRSAGASSDTKDTTKNSHVKQRKADFWGSR